MRSILFAFLATLSLHARPNVVFILADDLGWSDTTLYGTTSLYETPNLERLARRGMTFTRAYAASPLCSPTRASILSGQTPARHGITAPNCHTKDAHLKPFLTPDGQCKSATRFDPAHHTLAETLREAKYATAHFGKWHLGPEPYSPLEHGFDIDIPHWPGPGPAGSFVAPWKFKNFKAKTPNEHIEDRMGDEAVAFMQAQGDTPFFLNYWQFSVHAPFDAKAELIDYYRSRIDLRSPQRSPTYAAMVHSLDDNVGKILDAIDRLGIADNTLIIFTSDNGGNMYNEVDGTTPTSNAPLRGGKASMYEGGVRVPTILAWPGHIPLNTRSDALIQSTDFYPSILELLELPAQPEQHRDGISIVPALRGEPLERDAIFTYFPHSPKVPDHLPPSVSVHSGDWKLIRVFHSHHELYNLRDDIGEIKNLADTHPDKVRELDAKIERHLADSAALTPARDWGIKPLKQCELRIAGEGLHITSTGQDPYFQLRAKPTPGATHLRLRMRSNADASGQLRIGQPVQDFTVPRDGVVDIPLPAEGHILRIDPARSEGEIVIHAASLIGGETRYDWPFNAYPKKLRLGQGQVSNSPDTSAQTIRTRQAIFQHPNGPGEPLATLRFPQLPKGTLRFAIGLRDGADVSDGVAFIIRVDGKPIFREVSKTQAWTEHSVELEFPAEVSFHTDPLGSSAADWAAWGEPTLWIRSQSVPFVSDFPLSGLRNIPEPKRTLRNEPGLCITTLDEHLDLHAVLRDTPGPSPRLKVRHPTLPLVKILDTHGLTSDQYWADSPQPKLGGAVSAATEHTREARFWIALQPGYEEQFGPLKGKAEAKHIRIVDYAHIRIDSLSPRYRKPDTGPWVNPVVNTRMLNAKGMARMWNPCFSHRQFAKVFAWPESVAMQSARGGRDGGYFFSATYASSSPLQQLYRATLRDFMRQWTPRFRAQPDDIPSIEPNHEFEVAIATDQGVGDYNPAMIRDFYHWLRRNYGPETSWHASLGISFKTYFDAPRDQDRGAWDAYDLANPYFQAWVDFNRYVINRNLALSYSEALRAGVPPDMIHCHQIPDRYATGQVLQGVTRISPIDYAMTCGVNFGFTKFGVNYKKPKSNIINAARSSGFDSFVMGEFQPLTEDPEIASRELRYVFENGAKAIHVLHWSGQHRPGGEAEPMDEAYNRSVYDAIQALLLEDPPRSVDSTLHQSSPWGEGQLLALGNRLKSVDADGKFDGRVYTTPFRSAIALTPLEISNDSIHIPGEILPGSQIEILGSGACEVRIYRGAAELPGLRTMLTPAAGQLRYTLRIPDRVSNLRIHFPGATTATLQSPQIADIHRGKHAGQAHSGGFSFEVAE